VIDNESERAVTGWLRLGDHLIGRKRIEGRCDRYAETGYLSLLDKERLCAKCLLDREAAGS
jgi:hypothetical protein